MPLACGLAHSYRQSEQHPHIDTAACIAYVLGPVPSCTPVLSSFVSSGFSHDAPHTLLDLLSTLFRVTTPVNATCHTGDDCHKIVYEIVIRSHVFLVSS